MSTAVINELDQHLASLNQLKPPGASKGKIGSITQLCVNNIEAESSIVQSLYRAVKKAPSTHKLGAIYAIDSVVRRWIEAAKQQGQNLQVDGRGEPGTYPAAIKRVTELMPALVDDIVKTIPAEQKEKFESMIKIWEKGSTFPTKLLDEFRIKIRGVQTQTAAPTAATEAPHTGIGQKFFAPIPTRPLHTPVGTPPQYLYDQGLLSKKSNENATGTPSAGTPKAAAAQRPAVVSAQPQNVNSILSALANAVPKPAQQPTLQAPAPTQQAPQPPLPPNVMALFGQQQNGATPVQAATNYQQPTAQVPQFQMPQQMNAPFQLPQTQAPALPSFPFPQGFPGFPPQQPPSVPQQHAAVPPPPPPPPQQQTGLPKSQEELLAPLLHILPPNILNNQAKLIKALELLQELQKNGIPTEQWGPVLQALEQQDQVPAPQPDLGGYNDYDRNRGRDRSMSPDRRRRGSPGYDNFDDRRRQDSDRGGRGRYRQRSPTRDSPPAGSGQGVAMNGQPMQPKFIALDSSLPRDNIKVLSRTLFVGGAVGTQQEIHDLFSRFGRVQTCIANREKRHAFVKMTTRSHALEAKANLERLQSGHDREVMNIARQTKWGVGFGPRECCDYAKGESVIPIHKLTDADVKWLLTAEYGGTGGQNIESGMVLEEPDIEIGAGVSSKAMSKRVTVDSGPASQQPLQHGGKRQRDDSGNGGGHGRGRDRKRQHQQGSQGSQRGGGDMGYGGGSGGGYSGSGGQQGMDNYGYARPEPVAVATPPAVPGFGFPLSGAGQEGYR